jgi:predicted esterase
MAEAAEKVLKENGASVLLNTYDDGHGWHGNIYARVEKGIQWLETQAEARK